MAALAPWAQDGSAVSLLTCEPAARSQCPLLVQRR